MWRVFIILLLSIGILGGGFYYFATTEGWFDQKEALVSENNLDNLSAVDVVGNNGQIDWIDYTYQQNGVLFRTKYPAHDWKVVEQLNDRELTIIFTNNDSCQVMYLFDIRQGQYKSELNNNKNSESCAEVLQKIVSIATIPQFGVTLDEESESESATNDSKTQDGVASAELAITNESGTTDDKTEDGVTTADSTTTDKTATTDEKTETASTTEPALPITVSAGISDQEINEMSDQERYNSVKFFVNNWLSEYAKRRWSTLENQLSAKAKASLGGKTLASVATPFYYYELLTGLKQISLTQYQVNVKLTTKEEKPIGSGDGIYTLNIVWEYGEWKMDNYLFE